MFGRKKATPEVTISNGSYRRWLRSHRPPFLWFMGLTEDEQEGFAALGDAHILETAELVSARPKEQAQEFDHMMSEFMQGLERGKPEPSAPNGGIPEDIVEGLRARHKASMENVGRNPTTFLGMPIEGEGE